jgi:hypothetical protein
MGYRENPPNPSSAMQVAEAKDSLPRCFPAAGAMSISGAPSGISGCLVESKNVGQAKEKGGVYDKITAARI